MSNEETPPILTVTDAPGTEAEEIIEGGLAQFNEDNAGYRDSRRLAVLVSDPDTQVVVGGLSGRTSLGLLAISASRFCRTWHGPTKISAMPSTP
jgi:hypothetical protein